VSRGTNTDLSSSALDEKVSFLDGALVFAQRRGLFVRVLVVASIIGLVVALIMPAKYASTATVVRETQESSRSGASAALTALRGFGLDVGGVTTGLSAEAYPALIRSREVRLAVVRDTLLLGDRHLTFVQFMNEGQSLLGRIGKGVREYTVGLPGKIRRIFSPVPPRTPGGASGYPTKAEEDAIIALNKITSVSEDGASGLMRIIVSSGDPRLSERLASLFVQQLVERVREVYTGKARENLDFIARKLLEAEAGLRQAEEVLASFEDRNLGMSLSRLETDRQRLQRQVNFKAQLYSELLAQNAQAEVDLQKSEPVITVVERPVPPLQPTGPSRPLIFFGFVLAGGMIFGITALSQHALETRLGLPEEAGKLRELYRLVVSEPLDWIRRTPRSRPTDSV
jgi:tyrosine-protein kinase Etk/Wzc